MSAENKRSAILKTTSQLVAARTMRLTAPVRLAALSLMMSLTAACATAAPSGTEAACDALRPYLPTVSQTDSRETKESFLIFYETFESVCA